MALIIENGSLVANSDSYISQADFESWLGKYGYTVDVTDKEPLLRRAFSFIDRLNWNITHKKPYTVEQSFIDAQCHLSLCFSKGLDFTEIGEEKYTVVEALGRNALYDKYEKNKELSGHDDISKLKRCSDAYSLLSAFIKANGKQQRLVK